MAHFELICISDQESDLSIVSQIESENGINSEIIKRRTLRRYRKLRDDISSAAINKVKQNFRTFLTSAVYQVNTQYELIREKLDELIQSIENTPEENFPPASSIEKHRDILNKVFKERHSNDLEKDIEIRIFDCISSEVLQNTKLEQDEFKNNLFKVDKRIDKVMKRLRKQIEEVNQPVNADAEVVNFKVLKKYFSTKLWNLKPRLEELSKKRVELKSIEEGLAESIISLEEKVKSLEDNYIESENLKEIQNHIDKLRRKIQEVQEHHKDLDIDNFKHEIIITEMTWDELLELIQKAKKIDNQVQLSLEKLKQEQDQGVKNFDTIKSLFSEIEKLKSQYNIVRGKSDDIITVSYTIESFKKQAFDLMFIKQKLKKYTQSPDSQQQENLNDAQSQTDDNKLEEFTEDKLTQTLDCKLEEFTADIFTQTSAQMLQDFTSHKLIQTSDSQLEIYTADKLTQTPIRKAEENRETKYTYDSAASIFIQASSYMSVPQGLHNTQFNCFMSSIIQCLRASDEFIDILNLQTHVSNPIIRQFKILIQRLYSQTAYIDDFKAAICEKYPEYKERAPRDAMQFLYHILQELREVERVSIDNLFKLQYQAALTCEKCHSKSYFDHANLVLSLNIKRKETNIQTCLDGFISYTNKGTPCKKCRCEWRSVILEDFSYSEIMILHLNRYTNNGRKLENPIRVLEKVTLLGQPYTLFAVCSHEGNLRNGHFWSYVKSKDTWYLCNDTEILSLEHPFKQMNPEQVYILFFKKC